MKMNADGRQFEDYRQALDGAGPKLKEMILGQAERDGNLDFWDFR